VKTSDAAIWIVLPLLYVVSSCFNEDIEDFWDSPRVLWNAQVSSRADIEYVPPWIWVATAPASISTEELCCLMRLQPGGSEVYRSFERRAAEEIYRIDQVPVDVGSIVFQEPDNQIRDWRLVVVALVQPGDGFEELWFGDATFEADAEYGPDEGCGRERCWATGAPSTRRYRS
jgi:hypothetical protein